jgi:glyoxylase-like metal-dependent hydrolase (beta-lactamase superfamily II)
VELKQLTEQVYYLDAPTNIGLIKDGNDAILIDSGLDDSVAKKILRILKENNLTLKAIINTHFHADHCGANNYLQQETGVEIYAYKIESAIINYPYLEPLAFFSGANPIKDLKNKFLMAKESQVNHVLEDTNIKLKFDSLEVEIIPLQGHSVNQIGVVADGVLFCGDSIFSQKVIDKHKLLFYTDIEKQKATLEFLAETNYDWYLPSHTKATDDIRELAKGNLDCINEIEEVILKIVESVKSTEQILKETLDYYKAKVKSLQQYHLMKTLIMAYLSSLYNNDRTELELRDNCLYWKKANQ